MNTGTPTPTTTAMPSKEANDLIIVERFKFIQDKIKFLDNQYQSNLATLLKIVIALLTFIATVLMAMIELKIAQETVIFSIKFSGATLTITCTYLLLSSIAGILSWVDYRTEEVNLLDKINCDINRKAPSLKPKNIFRWHETHLIILLVILMIVGVLTFNTPNLILSMIH